MIVDREYYWQDTTCKHSIYFVYDPEVGLLKPAAIEDDLPMENYDFDLVVVSSPNGLTIFCCGVVTEVLSSL
ncbi:hypothetical protein [Rhodopirellula sp. SWK7]|uniref:PD-(D/E)XK nuclease domain-containing protein n=1 Tax=Rhodopirellula sp. SWK7 TaxID=595460 RepID=UPI0002BFC767|nr:hypothetical protein RRSWK_02547 [Rhodopirellula sp. SWK7]